MNTLEEKIREKLATGYDPVTVNVSARADNGDSLEVIIEGVGYIVRGDSIKGPITSAEEVTTASPQPDAVSSDDVAGDETGAVAAGVSEGAGDSAEVIDEPEQVSGEAVLEQAEASDETGSDGVSDSVDEPYGTKENPVQALNMSEPEGFYDEHKTTAALDAEQEKWLQHDQDAANGGTAGVVVIDDLDRRDPEFNKTDDDV